MILLSVGVLGAPSEIFRENEKKMNRHGMKDKVKWPEMTAAKSQGPEKVENDIL